MLAQWHKVGSELSHRGSLCLFRSLIFFFFFFLVELPQKVTLSRTGSRIVEHSALQMSSQDKACEVIFFKYLCNLVFLF